MMKLIKVVIEKNSLYCAEKWNKSNLQDNLFTINSFIIGQSRGGSSSWPCVAIATHEFLKKLEIFYLATEISISKSWKSVANILSGRNRDWNSSWWIKIGL